MDVVHVCSQLGDWESVCIYIYIYIHTTEPGCTFGRSLLASPGMSCRVVKKRCLAGTFADTYPIFVPSYRVTKRFAMYLHVSQMVWSPTLRTDLNEQFQW